VPPITGYTVVF